MRYLISGLVLGWSLCLSPVSAQDQPTQALLVETIADNGTYGCRRSFGFGVYDGKTRKTMVCWNGPGMDVYARQFDHDQDQWGPVKLLWRNNWTSKWDYHNYPTMIQAPDGHLLIFYFKHSQEAFMLRSPKPGCIDGQWTRVVLPADRPAYPMPIVCGKDIFLFYSRSDDIGQAYRTYRYIQSSDSGKHWSKVHSAIDSQQKTPGRFDEVYAIDYCVEPAVADRPMRIHLTWEMHGGARHNHGSRNNYFVYFLPETRTFQSVAGKNLGKRVDFEEMESSCVVQQGGAEQGHPLGYSIKSTYDSAGRPLVFYRNGAKRYLVQWDGKQWVHRSQPPQLADVRRKPCGAIQVIGSQKGKIVIDESTDDGRTWRRIGAGEFPHAGGSDRVHFIGFISGGRSDFPAMAGAINRDQRMSDYSGRWPVVAVRQKHRPAK